MPPTIIKPVPPVVTPATQEDVNTAMEVFLVKLARTFAGHPIMGEVATELVQAFDSMESEKPAAK